MPLLLDFEWPFTDVKLLKLRFIFHHSYDFHIYGILNTFH